MPFIDLKAQYEALKPQIQERINRVLEHGQYIMGPEVRELEERLEQYTGAKHCITVASGTEALLISLLALGIQPGDEVITTPFTFAATAEVIVLLGAIPVFVDIEPDTCNINASLIEEKITDKTKAIMPVSLFGQPCDMDEINTIAARHGNIPVIEDGAQSFGSTYKGKKSGNLSTIGCTSFFPSKPLGCYGDGGAIFTSDDAIAKACREIRVHGQSERYVHARVGVGGRMDTLQCAILLAKLERFEYEIEQRIKIGKKYNELFLGKLKTVKQQEDRTSVFAQYSVFLENRSQFQSDLLKKNIPTAIHYPTPIHLQPAYRDLCCPQCCPEAVNVSKKIISIPMHPELKIDQQKLVVNFLCI
ncbi:DegT/DnrJ/EryC1/StrS family aminotransferase [Polynucleobacter sp. MG-28-Ekke-A2]|nr:DegT/DnrJ/EryC1/StrS family aminotransferase [Polynucleobacter sp. MG-28-Ekke-A2]MEA9601195.1 DegT/DnrJ/EryC1/StrS family aminotransferase [Polynucleobacter sp. MG-28-Ekke-A2]